MKVVTVLVSFVLVASAGAGIEINYGPDARAIVDAAYQAGRRDAMKERQQQAQQQNAQPQQQQASYLDGYADGWDSGWREVMGQGYQPPQPSMPAQPSPDRDNYRGGYNAGFLAGMNAAKRFRR